MRGERERGRVREGERGGERVIARFGLHCSDGGRVGVKDCCG